MKGRLSGTPKGLRLRCKENKHLDVSPIKKNGGPIAQVEGF
jgi:hypothetical protein